MFLGPTFVPKLSPRTECHSDTNSPDVVSLDWFPGISHARRTSAYSAQTGCRRGILPFDPSPLIRFQLEITPRRKTRDYRLPRPSVVRNLQMVHRTQLGEFESLDPLCRASSAQQLLFQQASCKDWPSKFLGFDS